MTRYDMCGIAGYSLSPSSDVDRTRAAQALLAAIADRGADAVGYAHRCRQGAYRRHKQRTARAPCSSASRAGRRPPAPPPRARLHEGPPAIPANNHPVRHGAVVGIHNGHIVNDDELLAAHCFERAEPQMTVDSEVIFARRRGDRLAAPRRSRTLPGSMATAWLDQREPGAVFPARGVGRPLWLGAARREVFFASTGAALEIAARVHRACGCASEVAGRDAPRAVDGARVARTSRASARSDLPSRRPSAGRPRPRRERVLPRSGSPRSRLAAASAQRRSVPSRATSTPCSASRSRTRNWNVDQAPRRASNIR